MTKEELKQDAEKSLDKRLGTYAYIRKQDCYTNYVDGYTDGAEPRENQIQIDAEQIRALQKQNGELTDKVKEFEAQINRAFDVLTFKRKRIAKLEAQIEKMKSCGNCKYKYIQDSCDLGEGTRTDPCLSCRSNNMWEFDN